eukprot:scaffold10826_cov138-Skeletonema_marinoi.AAC.2
MLAAISDASSGHLRRCSGADSINKSLSQEPATISDASSGHLRRCSGADSTNKSLSFETDASILSWPTMVGH